MTTYILLNILYNILLKISKLVLIKLTKYIYYYSQKSKSISFHIISDISFLNINQQLGKNFQDITFKNVPEKLRENKFNSFYPNRVRSICTYPLKFWLSIYKICKKVTSQYFFFSKKIP